jgi:hypothetical protein
LLFLHDGDGGHINVQIVVKSFDQSALFVSMLACFGEVAAIKSAGQIKNVTKTNLPLSGISGGRENCKLCERV